MTEPKFKEGEIIWYYDQWNNTCVEMRIDEISWSDWDGWHYYSKNALCHSEYGAFRTEEECYAYALEQTKPKIQRL